VEPGKSQGRGGAKKPPSVEPGAIRVEGAGEDFLNGVYEFAGWFRNEWPKFKKQDDVYFVYYSTKQRKWYINDAFDDTGYDQSIVSDEHTPMGSKWMGSQDMTVSEQGDYTPSAEHKGDCVDLLSAVDNVTLWSDGTNDCTVYARETSYCHAFGMNDFSGTGKAQIHCCVCGGGREPQEPVPLPSPAAAPPAPQPAPKKCTDKPSALDRVSTWSDGVNSCEAFEAMPTWCDLYGDQDSGAGPAKSHCCGCGGGVKKRGSMGVPHGGCSDLPSKKDPSFLWNDGNNGCVQYAVDPTWCSMYGLKDQNGAGRAKDHCCACGGGSFGSARTQKAPAPMPRPPVQPKPQIRNPKSSGRKSARGRGSQRWKGSKKRRR